MNIQVVFKAVLLLQILFAHTAYANGLFDRNVVVVNYDVRTERAFGSLPTRAQMATYVDKIQSAKPRSVALKFFLDTEGVAADSYLLAASMAKSRVLLQASMNADPPVSRQLDKRFYSDPLPSNLVPSVRGDAGWLPIAKFAGKAAKVGFVDVAAADAVPMFVLFGNKPVPSFYHCILADAVNNGKDNDKFAVQNHALIFNDFKLPIDDATEVKIRLESAPLGGTISIAEVLKPDFNTAVFKDKVVVLIYTGSKSPTFLLQGVPVKVHELFIAQLRQVFARLQPKH